MLLLIFHFEKFLKDIDNNLVMSGVVISSNKFSVRE